MTDSRKINNVLEFDKLWNYNKPDETEKKFREILDEVKDSGNKSAYLQLLTQLARTQGLQRKFDEAHKILDEVESQILNNDINIVKIRYLLERGRTFNSSKQKEKARELFLEAYELCNETETDFYKIDAAHMLGIVEPPEEGLKWNETGMKLAEDSKDEKAKGWVGSFYNNIGWTYHDKNEFEKALNVFEKNVIWHTEKKSGDRLIIAKWCVARTLRSLGRIEEAIKIQKSLLSEIEEKKLSEDGFIFEELGECYLISGNKTESQKNFGIAYEMLSKDEWLSENAKDRLDRMKELSNT